MQLDGRFALVNTPHYPPYDIDCSRIHFIPTRIVPVVTISTLGALIFGSVRLQPY